MSADERQCAKRYRDKCRCAIKRRDASDRNDGASETSNPVQSIACRKYSEREQEEGRVNKRIVEGSEAPKVTTDRPNVLAVGVSEPHQTGRSEDLLPNAICSHRGGRANER